MRGAVSAADGQILDASDGHGDSRVDLLVIAERASRVCAADVPSCNVRLPVVRDAVIDAVMVAGRRH